MRVKFSRNSTFFKSVSFVVLISFIFTGLPLKSYAAAVSTYNLRRAAAKESIEGAQLKKIFEFSEKTKVRILGLSVYLARIGLSDVDSIARQIRDQFPLATAAEELSFMVCNDGLWVTGPEQEDDPQVFVRMNADGKNVFSERIKEIVKEAKGDLIEQGNIVKISLPASAPQARREILLEIAAGFFTERKVVADGLAYEQPAFVITPLMERMFSGSALEKKFLAELQKGAEEAKKKEEAARLEAERERTAKEAREKESAKS